MDKIKIKAYKVGSLHKALGIPEGQKIPASKLADKPGDSPALRKKKVFARNAAKWHGDGGEIDVPDYMQQPTIQDNIGMVPMNNPAFNGLIAKMYNGAQGIKYSNLAPSLTGATPITAPSTSQPKVKKSGGPSLGSVNINTLPLLQGADALVTNFIYNPQVQKEQARMLRNQLMPVTGPNNFAGNNDMPMYRKGGMVYDDGGIVDATSKKNSRFKASYETPSTYIPPQDPITNNNQPNYYPVDIFKPQADPVQVPQMRSKIEFSKELDSKGRMIGYYPNFSNASHSQALGLLGDLPDNFGGYPVLKSPDTYTEATRGFQPNSQAYQWNPYKDPSQTIPIGQFAQGGEVYKTNPSQANVLAESGELMQMPNGNTDMITGDRHTDPSGGEYMNVPQGTRIYSDRIKVPADIVSDISNTRAKRPLSVSKLANKFNTEKEEDIIKNSRDAIATRTAELMKDVKNSKLDQVFDYQESMKASKMQTPMMADGGSIGQKVWNGFANGVGQVGEMAPELTGLINSMSDFPIMTAKYQPQYLSRPDQLNMDSGLNRNLASTKPFLDSNSGNASIDSARALQALGSLQDADNQLYGQKFNYDAQSKQRTNEFNVQTENQANQYNLQRADDFWNKITARKAAKDASIQNIANSAYAKSKAKQMETNSLALINQMNPNFKYNNSNDGFMFVHDGQGNMYRVAMNYLGNQLVDPNDGYQTTIKDTQKTSYGDRVTTRKEYRP